MEEGTAVFMSVFWNVAGEAAFGEGQGKKEQVQGWPELAEGL